MVDLAAAFVLQDVRDAPDVVGIVARIQLGRRVQNDVKPDAAGLDGYEVLCCARIPCRFQERTQARQVGVPHIEDRGPAILRWREP